VSYDLSFLTRDGAPPISEEAFVRHFANRPGYREPGEYANEDTGVYFQFTFDDASVSFEINLYRPHVFALEAEPEVSAFVAAHDLEVEDPQMGGGGSYARERFLEGWNRSNRFAMRAVNPRDRPPTLPSKVIERCWQWNRRRSELQESLGNGVFVPMIMFGLRKGRVLTICAWPDAIPIVLPTVDVLAIARRDLAPRGFFRGPKPDTVFVEPTELEPILSKLPWVDLSDDRRYRDVSEPPSAIVERIRKLRSRATTPEMISVDRVLDEESIEEAR